MQHRKGWGLHAAQEGVGLTCSTGRGGAYMQHRKGWGLHAAQEGVEHIHAAQEVAGPTCSTGRGWGIHTSSGEGVAEIRRINPCSSYLFIMGMVAVRYWRYLGNDKSVMVNVSGSG